MDILFRKCICFAPRNEELYLKFLWRDPRLFMMRRPPAVAGSDGATNRSPLWGGAWSVFVKCVRNIMGGKFRDTLRLTSQLKYLLVGC